MEASIPSLSPGWMPLLMRTIFLSSLLFISAIIGFAGSFISLLISKWAAKRSMGVILLETPKNETEKWLLNTLSDISYKAKIKTPEFGIFESQQLNAFATGSSKNNSLVAISSGLINHMNRDEIEGVIAHEISHISNGDMITMTLIQGIINTFVIFFSRIIGHVVDRVVFKVQRGHGNQANQRGGGERYGRQGRRGN